MAAPSLILFIFLLSTIVTAASSDLSALSEELLSEGLISLDDRGVPTTVCAVSTKNAPTRIEPCTMTDGFGPRSVGCFAVWSGSEVLRQGCYSSQEIALRSQCVRGACDSGRKKEPKESMVFCCCHGALCNAA